jgi:hypothetical protein
MTVFTVFAGLVFGSMGKSGGSEELKSTIVFLFILFGIFGLIMIISRNNNSATLKKIENATLEISQEQITITSTDYFKKAGFNEMKDLKIFTSREGKTVRVEFLAKDTKFTLNNFEKMDVIAFFIEKYAGKDKIRQIRQILPWENTIFLYSFVTIITLALFIIVFFSAAFGAARLLIAFSALIGGIGSLVTKKSNWSEEKGNDRKILMAVFMLYIFCSNIFKFGQAFSNSNVDLSKLLNPRIFLLLKSDVRYVVSVHGKYYSLKNARFGGFRCTASLPVSDLVAMINANNRKVSKTAMEKLKKDGTINFKIQTDDEGNITCNLDNNANGQFTCYDKDWGKLATSINDTLFHTVKSWNGFSTNAISYDDSFKFKKDGKNVIITGNVNNHIISYEIDENMKINRIEMKNNNNENDKYEMLLQWDGSDEGFLLSGIKINKNDEGDPAITEVKISYTKQNDFKMPDVINITNTANKMNLNFKFSDYFVWKG